jgi:hypothetical protein
MPGSPGHRRSAAPQPSEAAKGLFEEEKVENLSFKTRTEKHRNDLIAFKNKAICQ